MGGRERERLIERPGDEEDEGPEDDRGGVDGIDSTSPALELLEGRGSLNERGDESEDKIEAASVGGFLPEQRSEERRYSQHDREG